MYLSIGNDMAVRETSIIGIFDLDNTSTSRRTREFLEKAEKEGDVYCPICHKLLHVEAGQVIPRCCGKVMEMLD